MGYFVVIDLEMCRVPKSNLKQYNYKNEIIEIGAAMLDECYKPVDKFKAYVHPVYGVISNFIRDLTGIKPEDVEDASLVTEAADSLFDWIRTNIKKDIASKSGDKADEAGLEEKTKRAVEDIKFVSWSTADKSQIIHEYETKQLPLDMFEPYFESWIDCQPMFSEKLKTKRKYRLEEALIASDIITEGSAHDGLVDAYNTALLYAKMNTETEFKLNKYYKVAHEENSRSLQFSLADMIDSLGIED